MEFRDYLTQYLEKHIENKNVNPFETQSIVSSFSSQVESDIERAQLFELLAIQSVKENFFEAVRTAVHGKAIARDVSRLCNELEALNIYAPNYSYFIYCYYYFVSKHDPRFVIDEVCFSKLVLEEGKVHIRKSFKNLFFGTKTEKLEKVFVVKDNILEKYSGTSPIVMIPEGVKMIANSCFENNQIIKYVYIPESVTSIGPKAFENCTNLSRIILSKNINSLLERTFFNCVNLEIIYNGENVVELCDSCFENCYLLTNIDCFKSLLSIKNSAFKRCTSLVLPKEIMENLQFIGFNALSESALQQCKLRNCKVESGAFNNCKKLISIAFDNDCQLLGDSLFVGARNLSWLAILCESKFRVLDLLNSKSSLETIGKEFPKLKKIFTSDIFESEFQYLTMVEEITTRYEDEIPANAFDSCIKLNKLSLKNKNNLDYPTFIGKQAFWQCKKLTNLPFKKGCKEISDGAFGNCVSLSNLDFLNETQSFGFNSLRNVNLDNFSFNKDWKQVGQQAFYNNKEKTFVFSLDLKDGVFEKESIQALSKIDTLSLTSSVNLGESVGNKICELFTKNNEEFANSYSINEIKDRGLKEDVTFENFASTSIFNVKSLNGQINNSLFKNCLNAQSITVDSDQDISTIGDEAFLNCSTLSYLKINNLKDVSIGTRAFMNCSILPEGFSLKDCVVINDEAFKNNLSLGNITLSENLFYLGNGSFAGCQNVDKITVPFTGIDKNDKELSLSHIFFDGEETIYPQISEITVTSGAIDNLDFSNLDSFTLYMPNIEKLSYIGNISNIDHFVVGSLCSGIDVDTLHSLFESGCRLEFDKANPNFLVHMNMVLSKTVSDLYYAIDNSFSEIRTLKTVKSDAFKYFSSDTIEVNNLFFEQSPASDNNIENFIVNNCTGSYFELWNSSTNPKDVKLLNIEKEENFNEVFLTSSLESLNSLSIDNCKFTDSPRDTLSDIETISLDNVSGLTLSNHFNNIGNIILKDVFCSTTIESLLNIGNLTIDNSLGALSRFAKVGLKGDKKLEINEINVLNVDQIPDFSFENVDIKKLVIHGNPFLSSKSFIGSKIGEIRFVDSDYIIKNSFIMNGRDVLAYVPESNEIKQIVLKNGYSYTSNLFNDLAIDKLKIEESANVYDGCFDKCEINELDCSNLDKELTLIGISLVNRIVFSGTVIDCNQFANLKTLEEVVLNKKTVVRSNAFDGCVKLSNINTSNIIEEVGDFAFSNTNLSTIELTDAVSHIGIYAFNNLNPLNISIPFIGPSKENSVGNFEYLFGDDYYNKEIDIAVLSVLEGEFDDQIFDHLMPTKINPISLSLPSSYNEIKDSQFEGWVFDSFNFENIKVIGNKSFNECAFKEQTFDKNTFKNLEKIGDFGLNITYNYPQIFTFKNLKSLGEYSLKIFGKCDLRDTKIKKFEYPVFKTGSLITSLSLPNKLESICDYAFMGITLKCNIRIPESVTSCGKEIFLNSKVKKIEVSENSLLSFDPEWNEKAKGFLFFKKKVSYTTY